VEIKGGILRNKRKETSMIENNATEKTQNAEQSEDPGVDFILRELKKETVYGNDIDSLRGTVLITLSIMRSYLERCVGIWRKRRAEATNEEDRLVAACYVDAFQSVHISLYGQLVPEEISEEE
jgi:hypothetical protein